MESASTLISIPTATEVKIPQINACAISVRTSTLIPLISVCVDYSTVQQPRSVYHTFGEPCSMRLSSIPQTSELRGPPMSLFVLASCDIAYPVRPPRVVIPTGSPNLLLVSCSRMSSDPFLIGA